jgi:ribulose-5-phosphate 4-epimerase/fuculose-1-phosphate aldolase
VAEAFYWMWYLEQSCRIQLAAQSSGAPLAVASAETVERTRRQFSTGPTKGWLPWQALRRKLDREQPDYCA